MQLNERTRARLYALTALACLGWLAQSLYQAHADGTLATWPTIILSVSLLVVIGYTGYCAVSGWRAPEPGESGDGDESDGDGDSADPGQK